jgi:hypothetical protein
LYESDIKSDLKRGQNTPKKQSRLWKKRHIWRETLVDSPDFLDYNANAFIRRTWTTVHKHS